MATLADGEGFTLADALLGIETSRSIKSRPKSRRFTLADALLGIETIRFCEDSRMLLGFTLADALLGIKTRFYALKKTTITMFHFG